MIAEIAVKGHYYNGKYRPGSVFANDLVLTPREGEPVAEAVAVRDFVDENLEHVVLSIPRPGVAAARLVSLASKALEAGRNREDLDRELGRHFHGKEFASTFTVSVKDADGTVTERWVPGASDAGRALLGFLAGSIAAGLTNEEFAAAAGGTSGEPARKPLTELALELLEACPEGNAAVSPLNAAMCVGLGGKLSSEGVPARTRGDAERGPGNPAAGREPDGRPALLAAWARERTLPGDVLSLICLSGQETVLVRRRDGGEPRWRADARGIVPQASEPDGEGGCRTPGSRCGHCGRDTSAGPDPCLGYLPGMSHACCGHGRTRPYASLADGRVPDWEEATALFRSLGRDVPDPPAARFGLGGWLDTADGTLLSAAAVLGLAGWGGEVSPLGGVEESRAGEAAAVLEGFLASPAGSRLRETHLESWDDPWVVLDPLLRGTAESAGERQPTPDDLGFEPDYDGGPTGWRFYDRDAGVELSTRRHADGMLELDEAYYGDTDHDLTLFPDAAAMACYLWREYPELFPDAEPWDTLPDGRRRELRWTRRGMFSVAAVGD